MAKKQQPLAPTPAEALEAELAVLLEQSLGDEELRHKLEALASQPAIIGKSAWAA